MTIRNQDWYDLNESRPYPLSDEATGVDDDGVFLPNGLIADIYLTFPRTGAVRRAYLGSITVTKSLVSATILSATDPSTPVTGYGPVAAISLPKPIDAHRQYNLDPLTDGAGGWIVWGAKAADSSDTAEEYSGRFAQPSQSILLPSVVRDYELLPVSSLGKVGSSAALTGLVNLAAGSDIEITKECRLIETAPRELCDPICDTGSPDSREVIVVRLAGDVGGEAENVLDKYKGPCQKRPESYSCDDPQPIEQIADVFPDCCGNITIELKGCATVTRIAELAEVDDMGDVVSVDASCGVMVNCDLGLVDACISPDRLPSADGTLPNEVDDFCEDQVELSITLPDTDLDCSSP